jgi:CheY-like chemotaxis protein
MPKKQILIVDDNTTLIEALKDVLEDEYEIESATNGRDALLKFSQQIPSVVLMDYKMPGMNGLETLRCMRTEVNPVPVIIMSAYGNENLMRSAIECGANYYISKPFTLFTVKETLERFIA